MTALFGASIQWPMRILSEAGNTFRLHHMFDVAFDQVVRNGASYGLRGGRNTLSITHKSSDACSKSHEGHYGVCVSKVTVQGKV